MFLQTVNTVICSGVAQLSLFESLTLPLNQNSVYRKIFGMHIWESVICVQLYCERLDLIHTVHKRNLDIFSMVYFILQIVLLENVSACFVALDVLSICVMNMT